MANLKGNIFTSLGAILKLIDTKPSFRHIKKVKLE
jgi:hypothetical protein